MNPHENDNRMTLSPDRLEGMITRALSHPQDEHRIPVWQTVPFRMGLGGMAVAASIAFIMVMSPATQNPVPTITLSVYNADITDFMLYDTLEDLT